MTQHNAKFMKTKKNRFRNKSFEDYLNFEEDIIIFSCVYRLIFMYRLT